MASNLTKYTVQEALNRETNFEYYAAAYDDSVNLSSATAISGITDFNATYGALTIFAEYDQNNRALEYSKVTVESDQALFIQLGTGGYLYDSDADGTLDARAASDFGAVIYVIAASLPITLTGYSITDLKIKMGGSGTLGITAWR